MDVSKGHLGLPNSPRSVIGLATGVSTFGGQLFGAAQYPLVGIVTQRAILLNLLLCAAIFAFWTQLQPIMVAIGDC